MTVLRSPRKTRSMFSGKGQSHSKTASPDDNIILDNKRASLPRACKQSSTALDRTVVDQQETQEKGGLVATSTTEPTKSSPVDDDIINQDTERPTSPTTTNTTSHDNTNSKGRGKGSQGKNKTTSKATSTVNAPITASKKTHYTRNGKRRGSNSRWVKCYHGEEMIRAGQYTCRCHREPVCRRHRQ